ncbi:unnamed protein product [Caenorhabditis angaria]|uniref:DUF19 domain-containing protein n=1 Tax=Caenorhabditis angaria TaxID=860376 RepID=A0A9P1ICU4_9PELO|nr:unnamed protein product [Caenorhabditis angaria]
MNQLFWILFVLISILSIGESAKEDTVACGELREEYMKVCSSGNSRKSAKDIDFCAAFDNICLQVPDNEPDKQAVPIPIPSDIPSNSTENRPSKKKNFTRFCKEFKNRYLYVCPDPFRFGQKAIVFCPVYSEKCQVPLPDKPVVPQRKSSRRNGMNQVTQLCRSYRNFAENYCSNPFLTSQSQYRAACDKYWRHCGRFHRMG